MKNALKCKTETEREREINGRTIMTRKCESVREDRKHIERAINRVRERESNRAREREREGYIDYLFHPDEVFFNSSLDKFSDTFLLCR